MPLFLAIFCIAIFEHLTIEDDAFRAPSIASRFLGCDPKPEEPLRLTVFILIIG